jgi:hypothetical protein
MQISRLIINAGNIGKLKNSGPGNQVYNVRKPKARGLE